MHLASKLAGSPSPQVARLGQPLPMPDPRKVLRYRRPPRRGASPRPHRWLVTLSPWTLLRKGSPALDRTHETPGISEDRDTPSPAVSTSTASSLTECTRQVTPGTLIFRKEGGLGTYTGVASISYLSPRPQLRISPKPSRACAASMPGRPEATFAPPSAPHPAPSRTHSLKSFANCPRSPGPIGSARRWPRSLSGPS